MSPTVTDTLARQASSGDERALSKIFREFHQPLYRYCLAILGNRQDAEDALQETMVKVLRALPGEKRTIALKPWLYRIAHNESIDLLRRRRASAPLEEGEPASGGGLAEQVETRLRLRQLIVDLGALPERQRGALLMREAAGLDFEEIAAALETSPAVARQTLYEARLGLRQMDAGRDMDCTAVTKVLSDGDRRVRRRRDIRAHLRDCAGCRQFAEEIDSRRGDLAAILPLPAVAATALLHGILGGGAGAAGAGAAGGSGGIGGLLGGTAAKSVGTATLLKGAAAVAVIAAIGVGAADRGGLIHIGSHDPMPTVRSGAGTGGQAPSDATTPPLVESGANSTDGPSAQRGSQSSIGAAQAASSTSGHAVAKSAAPASDGRPSGSSSEESGSASPAPGKSGVEHPHGPGHTKQTPAAATHGQETAAGNKPDRGSDSGSSGAGESNDSKPTGSSHPIHPTHPSHPTQPVKPASPPGSSPAAGPTAKPEGKRP